jgi:hypothetical protein
MTERIPGHPCCHLRVVHGRGHSDISKDVRSQAERACDLNWHLANKNIKSKTPWESNMANDTECVNNALMLDPVTARQ